MYITFDLLIFNRPDSSVSSTLASKLVAPKGPSSPRQTSEYFPLIAAGCNSLPARADNSLRTSCSGRETWGPTVSPPPIHSVLGLWAGCVAATVISGIFCLIIFIMHSEHSAQARARHTKTSGPQGVLGWGLIRYGIICGIRLSLSISIIKYIRDIMYIYY